MNGLYMLGTGFSEWKGSDALTVTFQMSEDCDEQGNSVMASGRGRMTWEMAEKFADFVLSDEIEHVPELVVEFTGVTDYEEISLMDRISDFFVSRIENRNQSLRFRLCTGLEIFQMEEVWKYLRKNENRIEIELVLHDFLDIKESVLYLWEKGVAEVFVHMEPEEEAEENTFESQLKELADYALENQLFRRCSCNFFEEEIAGCGWEKDDPALYGFQSSGVMVTPSGRVYSLGRRIGCSCEKIEKRMAGSMEAGVDPERIRPFCVISDSVPESVEKGLRLERIRANEYYFAQLWKRYRIRREKGPKLQRMFIPLNNQYFSSCKGGELVLTDKMLERSLAYCEKNGVEAVLIHPVDELIKIEKPQLHRMRSVHIVSALFGKEAAVWYGNVIPVSETKILEAKGGIYPENVKEEDASELSELVVWDMLLENADLIGNRNWLQTTDAIKKHGM